MANIKSAEKRILKSRQQAARNKAIKSRVRTFAKQVLSMLQTGDQDKSKQALIQFEQEIMKASSKGVYHKTTSSRKVSRLTQAFKKKFNLYKTA